MDSEDILKKLKSKEINCEQALEELANTGSCPTLLNDDNGHWAVSFSGFQNVAVVDEPQDMTSTCFVEAKDWKDTIFEAVVWALEQDF